MLTPSWPKIHLPIFVWIFSIRPKVNSWCFSGKKAAKSAATPQPTRLATAPAFALVSGPNPAGVGAGSIPEELL